MNGKMSPTISRSQTNNAHWPTRTLNGAAAGRSGAGRDPDHEQHDLDADDGEERPGEEDERRLGELRCDEIPVAEDHRREDAAGRDREDRQLEQERHGPERSAAPGERAADEDRRGGRQGGAGEERRAASPDDGDRVGRPQAATNDRARPGAARRTTVSATIGEPPSVAGRAWSDRKARIARSTAQVAVKARNPRVAPVRRLASTTAPNDPTARAVRTVQLMNARFSAIRSAGTIRV